MDIDTFRGVLTAVLMVLFIALCVWAYSRRRHNEFEQAARLPLGDDTAPPAASGMNRKSPSRMEEV